MASRRPQWHEIPKPAFRNTSGSSTSAMASGSVSSLSTFWILAFQQVILASGYA